MKKIIATIFLALLVLTNISCATFGRDNRYFSILNEIRSENINFGFMKLSNYLRDNPGTRHTQDIRFSKAEYYLQIQDYYDAANELNAYITDFPNGINTIFAYCLLYKISSEYPEDPEFIVALKEKFFNKSLFLVFSESKTKSYKSALNNEYKIVEYVDRIEVFKNNEPFIKVTP
jgi:outer membrane protein assembly factor BamD (BamD/ComL family)